MKACCITSFFSQEACYISNDLHAHHSLRLHLLQRFPIVYGFVKTICLPLFLCSHFPSLLPLKLPIKACQHFHLICQQIPFPMSCTSRKNLPFLMEPNQLLLIICNLAKTNVDELSIIIHFLMLNGVELITLSVLRSYMTNLR